ncbi:MAG: hypothetical protein HY098_05310 [Nitrospinae bacterium]|nr:hypothetical protein [Nitrospinota bacterium]
MRSRYFSSRSLLKASIVALALSLAFADKAFAELIVIVNKDNPATAFRAADLRRIYNGGKRMFENGVVIQPANLASDNPLGKDFFISVLHIDAESYRLFWVRMIFSGKGRPPVEFETEQEAIKFVAANKGGLAFVDSPNATDAVKTVKIIFDD